MEKKQGVAQNLRVNPAMANHQGKPFRTNPNPTNTAIIFKCYEHGIYNLLKEKKREGKVSFSSQLGFIDLAVETASE